MIIHVTTLRTTSDRGPKPCMDFDFTHAIKTSGTTWKITRVCAVVTGWYHKWEVKFCYLVLNGLAESHMQVCVNLLFAKMILFLLTILWVLITITLCWWPAPEYSQFDDVSVVGFWLIDMIFPHQIAMFCSPWDLHLISSTLSSFAASLSLGDRSGEI